MDLKDVTRLFRKLFLSSPRELVMKLERNETIVVIKGSINADPTHCMTPTQWSEDSMSRRFYFQIYLNSQFR